MQEPLWQTALWITGIGMGGVFAFLLFLIGAMQTMTFVLKEKNNNLDKVAVAIAVARRNK